MQQAHRKQPRAGPAQSCGAVLSEIGAITLKFTRLGRRVEWGFFEQLQEKFRTYQKALIVCLFTLLAIPVLAGELEIRLRATLTGPVFAGEQPSGSAQFEMRKSVKRFSVEVGNINLPDGTVVNVFVNGTKAGAIKLVAHGGTLFLSTAANQTVPNITVGSRVSVIHSGVKILGGQF